MTAPRTKVCSFCGADDESVYMRRLRSVLHNRAYLGQVLLCADCVLLFQRTGATVDSV